MRTSALISFVAKSNVHFVALNANDPIAALSDAVVVVQAPARSGALSTAAHAESLDIPVLGVPSAPWQPRSAGVLGLLRGGARICTSVEDVLSVIAHEPSEGPQAPADDSKKPHDFRLLDDESRRVLSALRGQARLLDEVAARAALPVHVALSTLTSLQLEGRVEARGEGRYGLVSSRRRLK